MNVARAWDVFVAEAEQLGASKVCVESARRVFEPALRAALLDHEAIAPVHEVPPAAPVVPRGPYAEAKIVRARACQLSDQGMRPEVIARAVGRTESWVYMTLAARRRLAESRASTG